jgi:hypothetical protein
MNGRSSLLFSILLIIWMWATVVVSVFSMLSPNGWLISFLPGSVLEVQKAVAAFFSATASTSF